jgi:endonuclease IV
MPEKLSSEIDYEKTYRERREILRTGFGVALCTKIKEGGTASFENQVKLAEEMNLSAVQFDFRNRDDEEIEQSKTALSNYRKAHHDVALSMHGETSKIDETNLDFKNKQRTFGEIEFLQEISGESYTVHPPSINQKVFKELPDDARNRIIKNYSDMFAQVIKKAFGGEKKFSIAIENMPVKGNGGAWGQSIEDILLLLKKVEQSIIEQGVDPLIAHGYVGATLDVNHALHDANPKDYRNILESWFKGLGDYLKVVHLYAPSSNGEEFEEKYELCLELASQFNPNAKIFMESKQNPEVTKELYNSAKQIS